MIRARRILTYAFAASLALAPVAVVSVRAELDHAHELGKKVKCSCGGCEQSAGTCYHVGGAFSGPCDLAKTMIKEIKGHLDKGLTDAQVIEAMIKDYGAGLVVLVIGRWRRRGVAAEAVAANSKTITPAMLERARALAQKATEE